MNGGKLMKKLIVLIAALIFVTNVFAVKTGTLEKVMKPDSLSVSGDQLYIAEGAVVSIFSMKDLKLIKQFGRQGEGPGEVMLNPGYKNKVMTHGEYILIDSINKVSFFSKDGKFVKELKKTMFPMQAVPIGDNFVVRTMVVDNDTKTQYMTINIYNSNLEKVKELGRQDWVQQGGQPISFDMIPDFINFAVYKNELYVEQSDKGFIIDVYDSQGNKLRRIEHPFEKIKVTQADKDAVIELFKEDPHIKQQVNEAGGWNTFKNYVNMKFFDYYPAIQNIDVCNDLIFVQTFKVKDGKEEYVIMDLQGKIIKKVFLPRFENTSVMQKLMGSKLFAIADNNLYYIAENDDEDWELHCLKID